jgi:hypothetical protein
MSLNCQAWQGDDAVECTGEVVGRDETGTPLCEHHLEKSEIYDYPRTPGDGGAALKAPQRS